MERARNTLYFKGLLNKRQLHFCHTWQNNQPDDCGHTRKELAAELCHVNKAIV